MTANPFDFTDLSDLPSSLQKSVMQSQGRRIRTRYTELMQQAGRPVSVAELRAAYFRVHGKEVSSSAVSASVQYLIKIGQAMRTARDQYAVVASDQAAAE